MGKETKVMGTNLIISITVAAIILLGVAIALRCVNEHYAQQNHIVQVQEGNI